MAGKPDVQFDAPPEKLRRLRDLQKRVAALRAAQVKTYATPGELALAVDPTMVQTPALDLIDSALVDVAEGRCDRLILSMPPQEGKSQKVTRFTPTWLLKRNTNLRLAIVSYGDDIAGDMSYMIRNDITTFDGTDPDMPLDLGLRLRQNTKAVGRWYLASPAKGGLYAVGIGGALTSKPVDFMIIDDPVKDYRAADSDVLSEAAWNWWMSVARPRLAPGAPVVLVQTRWHENDLAGRLIAKQKADAEAGETDYDQWRVISIPAQADHDPVKGETDPLGREPGQFMISARGRTEAQWRATKVATAPRIWNAMYQGHPSPESGNVWKRQWWRRYSTMLWSLDANGAYRVPCDEMIQTWDMTFKDTKSADFVVGMVLARRGAEVFVLDVVRKRLSFTDTVTAFRALTAKWPQATAKLVEDKANGSAVIDSLEKEIGGIIAVNPKESKYARASATSPFIQAGNVLLPDAAVQLFDPEELIDEAAAFPNGAHDDLVDGLSQGLARMLLDGNGAAAWTDYIRNLAAAQEQEAAAEQTSQVDLEDGLTPLQRARQQQFRAQHQ